MSIRTRYGPILVVLAGLAILLWRWDAWPDATVDSGRELYTAWRIASGDLLYRDIAWFNGPLSPHVNALWFTLFGVSTRTLVLCNLALLALFVLLVYRILLDLSSHLAASAGALILLGVFALGQHYRLDSFNYLTPYSHEAVHGLYLCTLMLFLLGHVSDPERPGPRFGAGLCLGLLALTRPETLLAALAALTAGALVRGRCATWGALHSAGWFLAGAVLPPGCAYLLLAPGLGPGGAAHALTGAWPALLDGGAWSLSFYREMAGLEAPLHHLAELALWALLWTAALGGCALAASLALRPPYRRILPAATGALMAAAILLSRPLLEWTHAPRPLPLFAGAALALLLIRAVRSPEERTPSRAREAAWAALALVLPLRLGLKATFFSYGFTLLLPATLLTIVILLHRIPALLERKGRTRAAFTLPAALLLAALALAHIRFTVENTALRSERVGQGADSFLADSRADVVRRTLRAIATRTEPHQTLAVLPEGALINFLARRRNPTPFVNFMPPELLIFGEERILTAFESSPPDFVLLASRPMPEYGYAAFGHGYATRLAAWVEAHYRRVLAIRREGEAIPFLPFEEIVLMERRGG